MTLNMKYPWKSNKGRAMSKAHAVVSALSDEDVDDYGAVVEVVLLTYELVSEAYRQKF